MAPSVSLWCHWVLTSTSAGMLFIYTSNKSGSLDLQHKLCQASWEITWCECVWEKTSTRNVEDIKHIWDLNCSAPLHSNEKKSPGYTVHADTACSQQQINYLTDKIHVFFYSLWTDRFEVRAFILSSLQFLYIILIKEDMRTKTGKSISLYCTLLLPFSVQLAFQLLNQTVQSHTHFSVLLFLSCRE